MTTKNTIVITMILRLSYIIIIIVICITPPKFNMAPEKLWLEDHFTIGNVTF